MKKTTKWKLVAEGKCRKSYGHFWVVLWKICLKNRFIRGIILLRTGIIFFRFAYWRDRNSSFLWFPGFCTCPDPAKPIIFISGDTNTLQQYNKTAPHILKEGSFYKYQHFANFWKGGHWTMMKIRLIKSWEYLIWEQYLPEHMKWKFCIFETKKPYNHRTIKP